MRTYVMFPLLLVALFSGACAPGFRLIEPGDDGQRSVIVGDELVRYTAPKGYVDKTHEPSSARLGKVGFLSKDNRLLAVYDSRDRLLEFFTVTTPNELLEKSATQSQFEVLQSVMTQALEKSCGGGGEKKPTEGFYLEDCRVFPEPQERFSFVGSCVMVSEKSKSPVKIGYFVSFVLVKGKILEFSYQGFLLEKDGFEAFIARGRAALAAMRFEQNPAVAADRVQ